MASVIEQAKQIPASTIAEQQGVILKRQGGRQWACCPLHSDQRPSLCFYPDGSWHCFSCGAGGDSVALLASMQGISQLEAARQICDQHHPAAAAPAARNVYSWKNKRVKHLRETIRTADEYTGQYTVETADDAFDDPIFRAAIMARAQANCKIDELYAADRQELEALMARGCSAGG